MANYFDGKLFVFNDDDHDEIKYTGINTEPDRGSNEDVTDIILSLVFSMDIDDGGVLEKLYLLMNYPMMTQYHSAN